MQNRADMKRYPLVSGNISTCIRLSFADQRRRIGDHAVLDL